MSLSSSRMALCDCCHPFAPTLFTSNIQGQEEVVKEKHLRCCWPPREIHEGMFIGIFKCIFFLSLWLSMAVGYLKIRKYWYFDVLDFSITMLSRYSYFSFCFFLMNTWVHFVLRREQVFFKWFLQMIWFTTDLMIGNFLMTLMMTICTLFHIAILYDYSMFQVPMKQ